MGYVPTKWQDRVVTQPGQYKDQKGNVLILTEDFGEDLQPGIFTDATRMNNIELGIVESHNKFYSILILSGAWVFNEESRLWEYTIEDTNFTEKTVAEIRWQTSTLDFLNDNGIRVDGETFDGYAILTVSNTRPSENLVGTLLYNEGIDLNENEI